MHRDSDPKIDRYRTEDEMVDVETEENRAHYIAPSYNQQRLPHSPKTASLLRLAGSNKTFEASLLACNVIDSNWLAKKHSKNCCILYIR